MTHVLLEAYAEARFEGLVIDYDCAVLVVRVKVVEVDPQTAKQV